MKSEAHPADLLRQLAEKCIEASKEREIKHDLKNNWSGIGFSICGQSMVASISEISEIIKVPNYTFIPGVKSWVSGIANIRGSLLPIINIEEFFGTKNLVNKKNQRVLIIDLNNIYVGLIVNKVYGLQNLPLDRFSTVDQSLREESFSRFLDSSIDDGNQTWLKFSMNKLTQDKAFLEVPLPEYRNSIETAITQSVAM